MWPRCGACLPPMPLSVSSSVPWPRDGLPSPALPGKLHSSRAESGPSVQSFLELLTVLAAAPGGGHQAEQPCAPGDCPMHDPLGSGHLSLSAMAPGPHLLAVPLYRRWDQRAERGKPWEVSYNPAWFSGGQWLAQVHTGMKGVVTSRAQFFQLLTDSKKQKTTQQPKKQKKKHPMIKKSFES